MSKLTKFINSPSDFFKDALKKRRISNEKIYVIGFSTWKQYIRKYFSDKDIVFLPKNISLHEFENKYKAQLIKFRKSAKIMVWGFKAPSFIFDFSKQEGVDLLYVEDGFIRSIELGATKSPPMSLCFDSKTPYFNARESSDLEILLNTHEFDNELIVRSSKVISSLIKTGVSKYNNSSSVDVENIYGIKNRKRVLVLGQVEDDASIAYGSEKPLTNNQLIELAFSENPDAQIIYKPHPDVINGYRNVGSDLDAINGICEIFKKDIPLNQSFEKVDHVYTQTSLGGFEALLRGIKVTVTGCPFYAGWGLTDDRQENNRRRRILKIEELFAVAYILYPKYYSPDSGMELKIEDVINIIYEKKIKSMVPAPYSSNSLSNDILKLDNNIPLKIDKKKIDVKKVPDWFNPYAGENLKNIFSTNKTLFLYYPWIAEHGNTLISKIDGGIDFSLIPFDLVNGIENNSIRLSVNKFARENPEIYKKIVIRRLVPICKRISGFIFTFDWSPAMRIVVEVCRDLNIPTILIPHESVFVDREKYYLDITAKASVPTCDVIWSWGGLQRDIFVERGYPADKVISVGAPKFDVYHNYQASLSRLQFCQIYGLETEKKIILFASQPLDSQLNQKIARESQRQAISDVMQYCKEKECQLIIRMPPSKDNILDQNLRDEIECNQLFVIDDAYAYLVSAEEAIYHADVVTSINSTMLFEGVLSGRPAYSMKYVEFDQIWEKAGIPAAKNYNEMEDLLDLMLSGEWVHPIDGLKWAEHMFGVGVFDGLACQRIRENLTNFCSKKKDNIFSYYKSPLERLWSSEPLDVIAIPSNEKTLSTTQKYLLQTLNARVLLNSSQGINDANKLSSADIFFQWGITPSDNKNRSRLIARNLGRPVVYIEDGFIRSVDIGLAGGAGLSVILDDTTSYYDAASKPSRLERLLQSGPDLSKEKYERSVKAINKIVTERVSKYNHAIDPVALGYPLKIGRDEAPKILLIDQRFGDQSVTSGLASEESYEKMLEDALMRGDKYDVLIKRHPDAIKGGKSSYFSDERIAKYMNICKNIYLIDYDVNPYAIFDIVSEVYVATSGMGFEALMAGKKVHCYGVPFYSGWGLTKDMVKIDRRTRVRSVEDVFYYSYIESSRYFDPDQARVVQVEDIVDYIVNHRG